MSYRYKNLNNHSTLSNKQLNRNSINSSLINISKQLNNISINDINILKLKNEKTKINSKNKINSTMKTEYNNNCSNKNFKYTSVIYRPFLSFDEIYDKINFSFCHSESFSILANKYITTLNKNDLRKKNYILKENLKFLLNEIKKYKNSEINYDDYQIKEYESKLEYYMNEIKKYQKELILLKEKYNKVIKENRELQKYIKIDGNKTRKNKGMHLMNKTDLNKSIVYKTNSIKNCKKINYNIKNFLNRDKNIIKENYSTCTTKASRNNKKIDFNIINNINSNKYLFIDDKNSFQNSNRKLFPINTNISNNLRFIINSKTNYKNKKKIIIKNKNSLQKISQNSNKNDNKINQIIFSRIENNRINNYDNRTLSKNRLNQNSLKNSSFELNKSVNLSQTFRYIQEKEIKKLDKKKLYHNKYNNYFYLNNHTFHN